MTINIDLAGAMDKITPEMYEIASRHMTDVYIDRCDIYKGFCEAIMGIGLQDISNANLRSTLEEGYSSVEESLYVLESLRK
jgi:hypothetical protein